MARKNQKTLQNLFLDTLKDIYYAENKILAKAAQGSELRRGPPRRRAGCRTL
jgi:ferritin-like metal-binding protein YciE